MSGKVPRRVTPDEDNESGRLVDPDAALDHLLTRKANEKPGPSYRIKNKRPAPTTFVAQAMRQKADDERKAEHYAKRRADPAKVAHDYEMKKAYRAGGGRH